MNRAHIPLFKSLQCVLVFKDYVMTDDLTVGVSLVETHELLFSLPTIFLGSCVLPRTLHATLTVVPPYQRFAFHGFSYLWSTAVQKY